MPDQTMVENLVHKTTKEIHPEEHTRRVHQLQRIIDGRVLSSSPDSQQIDIGNTFDTLPPRERADLLYDKLMAFAITERIIRQEGKSNPDVKPEPVDPYLVAEIRTLWQDPQTRNLFVESAGEALIDKKLYRVSETGKKWKEINADIADTRRVFEEETRRLFLQHVTRPDQISAATGRTARLAKELINLQQEKRKTITLDGLPHTAENTDVAANIMHETLSMYHNQLNQGFVWLPTRLDIHVSTLQSLQNARWPVLRGEAGTGKSEQADAAALVLTGEQPTHLAASDKTGERQLIADKEIDPSGGSYELYGQAMQAATGYNDSRQSESTFKTGRMVRIDESGRLGKDGYSTIKELRQKRPATPKDIQNFKEGKTIDPDKLLHGKPVLPGFAAILATNPEGSRYPDRTEPDAALRRELSYITVDYPDMSPTNPELYEFMLAALMDNNQHIAAAKEELAPAYTLMARNDKLPDGRQVQAEQQLIIDENAPMHGTLYRLSHAIRALQDSFIAGNQGIASGETLHFETQNDGVIKIMEVGGEPLTLSNSTITLGEISSWMQGFRDRRLKDDPNYQVDTLTEWVQLKLKTYLNQVDEIDKDKIEAIFNYFHLFDPVPDLSHARPLTPKDIGYLSPRVPRPLHLDLSAEAGRPMTEPPAQVPTPDLHTDISGLLEDSSRILIKPGVLDFEREGRAISLRNGSLVTLGGEKFRFAGFSPDGRPIVRLANEDLYRVVDLEQLKKEGEFNFVLQEAETLFGQDFLGPEQIEKAFGIKIDDVPEIQFSLDELRQAKDRGEMLVLYTDKAPDGQSLTMEKMFVLLKPQFDKDGKGGVLYNTEWCRDEDFFKKEAPKAKWGLVGKDFIPNSTDKNYLQQTEALADFVKNTVFKGQPIPPEYQEAIREFEIQKGDIGKLLGSDWGEAGKRLAALKLTQMTRTSPVEDAYRLLAYFQNSGDKLLPATVNWTNRRASDGYFVYLGNFGSFGVLVYRWNPGLQVPDIGVCFSR